MKIERLKKSHKKEIIIGALAVCAIGGTFTFNTLKTRDLAQDKLLISEVENYKLDNLETIAMYQQNDSGTYTEITTMPTSGYVINEDKTYCTTDNKTQVKGKIKTINGNHIINNMVKSDKCYLYFDKEKTGSEIILANAAKGTGTPTFSKTACSSGCGETTVGTYTISDGMYGGTSTYWRGDVTDNYVRFANFCWRIVRVNGDGSIRLIYDGTTCHANGTSTAESIAKASTAYNSTYNQSYYVGWTYSTAQRPSTANPQTGGTASNVKTQLESWYASNITGTNATKAADGKYCNDRNVQSGSSWAATGSTFYYAGNKRLYTDYQPTLSCSNGDIYSLKVGLITADEVELAGGKNENNQKYYLYNGQNYWTMSPNQWYGSNSRAGMFSVRSFGTLSGDGVNATDVGLRPVINLKADTLFATGGTGTQSNPYVVQ